jgi:hypothetical protein
MRLRLFTLGVAMAAMPLPESWAEAPAPAVVLKPTGQPTTGTVELSLRAADATAISQSLGEALGAAVRVDGTVPAPVTLELRGVSGRAALDAIASAIHGTWRPIYIFMAGTAPGGARRPVPIGRTVTASLSGVSARTALSLVARGAGGSVEMQGELPQNVSLKADGMPVEQALDEIARQVGGAWTVTYVIHPGTTPATAASTTAPPRGSAPNSQGSPERTTRPAPGRVDSRGLQGQGVPPDARNDQRSFPMPFEPQAPPPDPNAAKMLGEGLARVMQMPATQRRAAVKDFASQIDQQFRQMQALPSARKTEQMAAMRPLYQAAVRTYSGLTPDQKKEFQPIVAVFNRWMR